MRSRPIIGTLLPALCLLSLAFAGTPVDRVLVSPNGHNFQYPNGAPFFWLADTGWLLFRKLDRPETERYLDNRRRKGFNVVQVMVLHEAGVKNAYGVQALVDLDPPAPILRPAAISTGRASTITGTTSIG